MEQIRASRLYCSGGKRAEYGAQIVSTQSTQLIWSNVIEILPLKEALQREFYLTMASSNKWSVRTLRKEIDGSLYQRTAIAGKDNKQIHQEPFYKKIHSLEQ